MFSSAEVKIGSKKAFLISNGAMKAYILTRTEYGTTATPESEYAALVLYFLMNFVAKLSQITIRYIKTTHKKDNAHWILNPPRRRLVSVSTVTDTVGGDVSDNKIPALSMSIVP